MAVPERIGKYEIRREIGRGGMGIVYEGFDPHIERRVAVKVIRPDMLDRDEASQIIARFKREAQAGGRLSHPSIVPVYEYGEEQDWAFIAMEYVEGRGLKAVFDAKERFGLEETVAIMRGLLDGLDYAHRQGVVHRDIKPANVILTRDRHVKIADFGLARLESSTMTQTGALMGTPTHMSPEQMRGLEVDGRSDLFSAGVILYEFLTGRRPFTGSSIAAVMHQVLEETPDQPDAVNPAVPRAVAAVAMKALAKKLAERFQTAREFAEALSGAARGGSPAAAPGEAPTVALPAPAGARAQRAVEPTPAPAPATALAPGVLAEVEAELARHLGPLARMMVRRAAERATDPRELCRLVAEDLPSAAQKAAFLARVARLASASIEPGRRAPAAAAAGESGLGRDGKPDSTPPGWSPETLALAERRLAAYIGPVARILVRKAAAGTTNPRALYQTLAESIENDRDRRAFLAAIDRS